MAVADNFPPASFDGIRFPYVERHVKGSIRHHVHEYPHAVGGNQEPLGRRLYEFSFTSDFDEAMNGLFPALYPKTLVELFAIFGEQRAAPLEVPGVGTFTARCVDWDARKVSRIRSGEKLTFRFLEVLDVIVVDQSAVVEAMPQEVKAFRAEVQRLRDAARGALPAQAVPTDIDLADVERLVGLVTALVSAKSSSSLSLVPASRAVMSLSTRIDARPYLRFARAHAAVESLHRIAASANATRRDAERRSKPLALFITQRRMSIIEVAAALYGDTSRTRELMRLNELDDALSISSGTAISHYPMTTTARAA